LASISEGKSEKPSQATPPEFFEFIAIEWFGCVHGDELDITNQTKLITPPTVELMRQFGNTAAMDILLYQTPEFQHRITMLVTERMNYIYQRFCELHPGFSGKCSIVGHSLGSVISFDILCAQEVPSCDESDARGSNQQQQRRRSSRRVVVVNAEEEAEVEGAAVGGSGQAEGDLSIGGAADDAVTPAEHLTHSQLFAAFAPAPLQQLVFKPSSFFAIGSPVGVYAFFTYADIFG
jgi:hypothetical protein